MQCMNVLDLIYQFIEMKQSHLLRDFATSKPIVVLHVMIVNQNWMEIIMTNHVIHVHYRVHLLY